MENYVNYNPGKFTASDEYTRKKQKADYYNNQQYRDFQYKDFSQSDRTNTWEQAMKAVQNRKPGDMTFSRQGYADDIIGKIQNQKPFTYDVNGDALYQQYKDQYTAQGKLAMQDTMAQAQAMTGGYGNSWAQSAGQQAYQGYMQQLTNKIPELYQLAYDKYNNDRNDLYKQKSMLDDEYAKEYNLYRDTVSDWQYELNYNTGRYDASLADDKDQYQLGYNKAKDETDSHNTNLRNYQDLWNTAANNQYSQEYGEWSDYEKLKQAAIESANTNAARKQSDSIEAQKLALQKLSALSSGSSGSEEPFQKYTYSGEDSKNLDNNRFYRDGKEYSVKKGVNPYTGTTNKDVKNGTFGNGYQPNNIEGKKLKQSDGKEMITVNGVVQKVWQTPDGTKWFWDGTENRYKDYEKHKNEFNG